ncbi:MAG: acyl-CoA thioesterase, partial [Sphingobium sp.]
MTSAETVATDLHQEDPAGRVAALFNLLDVREVGERRFTGLRKHGGVGRVYGGQVVAQALAAASQTVEPDRLVHSLHAYFLRGGSEDHEIEFQVEADFDGGSFSNRRVIALQQGKVIFNLAASFHVTEPGHHHQDHMPDVAEPDDL